jgi:hypothetical protein
MSGVTYYFSLVGKIEAGLTTLFESAENGEKLGVEKIIQQAEQQQ